jgi:hypothetical protein
MDLGQGLEHCQCASVIDIICGARHKIELTPWVKTLVCKELRYGGGHDKSTGGTRVGQLLVAMTGGRQG